MNALALPLLFALTPQDPAFEITQALLDDAVAKARPTVERLMGTPIPEGFAGARLTDIHELEELLMEENVPIMRSYLDSDSLARSQARQFGRILAPALLAKYADEERAILVSQEGFEFNAEVLAMPELLAEDVVRAVIVHELVHAVDVPVHDFFKRCAGLGDAQRIQTLNAVLEGHAQFIARQACRELGLLEALKTYDGAIVGVPASEGEDGEGMRLMRQIQREALNSLYTDGERFVTALFEARGREGILQAFRDPPVDLATLQRPEWYLHPERRPKIRFDLEAALDAFAATYDDKRWQQTRLTPSAAQVTVGFRSLDAEVVEHIEKTYRHGSLAQLSQGMEAMHYLMAVEWATPADAERVVQASLELQKLRDEQMKEGQLQIESADYQTAKIPGTNARGFLVHKVMSLDGQKIHVQSLAFHEGPLSYEFVLSGATQSAEQLMDVASRAVLASNVEIGAEEEAPASGEN